jgi:NRAMP (natural resistance-associated macrophage protein)-like metal ion transporter
LAFLAVLGPGIITSAADNDAGGITTYSVAGAKYGFQLLWVIVVITIVLAMVQEMAARMGTVTQKGLGELIRENFGVRWTLFALSVLLVANVATTIAEFAGITASTELFGISRFISVPLCAVAVWFLVVRGSFKTVERVFLALALLYGTYIVSGILASPNWSAVGHSVAHPSLVPDVKPLTFDAVKDYLYLIIAVIGTTITPWMQFFLQATVVDKGIDIRNYVYQKIDVLVGSFLTDLVSFFIIIAAASAIYYGHAQWTSDSGAEHLALALKPLADKWAALLFGAGLFAASLLAAAVLPLSTAYTFTEAFGFEIGISRRLREAPAFYGIFTSAIVIGAGVALLPGFNPINAMIVSQIVNGMLLPIILYFMLKLINNKKVMGAHTNGPIYNTAVWFMAFCLVVFSIICLIGPLFGL